MRKSLLTFFAFLSLAASPAFAAPGETVQIKILGMVCDFCAQTMEKVFLKTEQVEAIDIDLKGSLITLTMKEGQAFTDEEITKHITDSGYEIESIQHLPEAKNE